MSAAAHSEIGASSMSRWSKCPGSVRMSRGIESQSSSYAEEGTTAHFIAAKYLNDETVMPVDFGEYPISEMKEAIDVYVDFVKNLVATCKPNELHCVDLKYGAGLPVEVKDNPQLRYYSLGCLLTVKEPSGPVLLVEHRFDLSRVHPGCFGTADAVVVGGPNPTVVHMHIVQPRCNHPDGPIRTETMAAVDLLEFWNDLEKFAQATEQTDAPLVPGDHCRFCKAAGFCPALKDRAMAAAKLEFSPALPYDPVKLAEALDSREIVKAWLKALDEFAYGEAERGRDIPHYKLVEKRAIRSWIDEDAAKTGLMFLGLEHSDIFEAPSLKSPTTIEKIIGKEDKEYFGALIKKESSGLTLVHESDKREAVRKDAKSQFKPVAQAA